eukprot:scaffold196445_cov34-Prasinocladus_malaysianus.AAC.1
MSSIHAPLIVAENGPLVLLLTRPMPFGFSPHISLPRSTASLADFHLGNTQLGKLLFKYAICRADQGADLVLLVVAGKSEDSGQARHRQAHRAHLHAARPLRPGFQSKPPPGRRDLLTFWENTTAQAPCLYLCFEFDSLLDTGSGFSNSVPFKQMNREGSRYYASERMSQQT